MRPGKLTGILILVVGIVVGRAGGASAFWKDFSGEIDKIAREIREGESAAVSWIYEVKSGDVTELGNAWRDRTEKALRDKGITVKVRREIGILIEDAESFGFGKEEKDVWRRAGADVVVSGGYRILKAPGTGERDKIKLHIKAFRLSDSTIVNAVTWTEEMGADWMSLASVVRGNIFHEKFTNVTPPGESSRKRTVDTPPLRAHLDRDPPCYPPESRCIVHIETEPGAHVYLFNLAADHTATLLHLNPKQSYRPLPSGKFVFPPPAFADDRQLILKPLKENEPCQEAIKVVASRDSMDFSFLPVPVNQTYTGAQGGDIKRMLDVLNKSTSWNEVTLTYWVGEGCR